MINIRKTAILAISSVCLFATSAKAIEFEFKNVYHAWMKVDPEFDYKGAVEYYMRDFRKDVWEKYNKDEFEIGAKKAETIKMMQSAAAKVDLADPFIIRTGLAFGEYNFENNSFELKPFEEGSYFPSNCNCYTSAIKVFFENPDLVDGIKMPTDQAKAFLAARKDKWGNVNRQVVAELKVVIVKADAKGLIGKLTNVRLFEDQKRTKVLAEYPAK